MAQPRAVGKDEESGFILLLALFAIIALSAMHSKDRSRPPHDPPIAAHAYPVSVRSFIPYNLTDIGFTAPVEATKPFVAASILLPSSN
jgi:hypothetical protein